MKFIHTADWHIGAAANYIPDAIPRQLSTLRALYKLALEIGVNTIVVAGDIWDHPGVDRDTMNLLQDLILTHDKAGVGTIMIPGNHDQQQVGLSTLSSWANFTKHGGFQHSVIVNHTELIIRNNVGFLLFTDEPWENLTQHIADIRTGSLDLGLDALVVVAHATVRGSQLDTGFTLEHGIDFQRNKLVDYYALGDIHLRQRVCKGAYFCGSPLQVNFGEDMPKGVLLVDTDKPDKPKFLPLPSIELVTISSAEEEIPKGSYVRMVYDQSKPATNAQQLPENVVKTVWTAPQVDLTSIKTDDHMFSGLDQILKQRDLDDEEIKMAHKELDEVLISLGTAV